VVFTGKSVCEIEALKRALERSSAWGSRGKLEYTLVSRHRSSSETDVRFGVETLGDQLELAGKVGMRRRKGDEVVGASLTLRVVAV